MRTSDGSALTRQPGILTRIMPRDGSGCEHHYFMANGCRIRPIAHGCGPIGGPPCDRCLTIQRRRRWTLKNSTKPSATRCA